MTRTHAVAAGHRGRLPRAVQLHQPHVLAPPVSGGVVRHAHREGGAVGRPARPRRAPLVVGELLDGTGVEVNDPELGRVVEQPHAVAPRHRPRDRARAVRPGAVDAAPPGCDEGQPPGRPARSRTPTGHPRATTRPSRRRRPRRGRPDTLPSATDTTARRVISSSVPRGTRTVVTASREPSGDRSACTGAGRASQSPVAGGTAAMSAECRASWLPTAAPGPVGRRQPTQRSRG